MARRRLPDLRCRQLFACLAQPRGVLEGDAKSHARARRARSVAVGQGVRDRLLLAGDRGIDVPQLHLDSAERPQRDPEVLRYVPGPLRAAVRTTARFIVGRLRGASRPEQAARSQQGIACPCAVARPVPRHAKVVQDDTLHDGFSSQLGLARRLLVLPDDVRHPAFPRRLLRRQRGPPPTLHRRPRRRARVCHLLPRSRGSPRIALKPTPLKP